MTGLISCKETPHPEHQLRAGMKAAVLAEVGIPPCFGDFAEPEPVDGQTVVEMAAAGVHHLNVARAIVGHRRRAAPQRPQPRRGRGLRHSGHAKPRPAAHENTYRAVLPTSGQEGRLRLSSWSAASPWSRSHSTRSTLPYQHVKGDHVRS